MGAIANKFLTQHSQAIPRRLFTFLLILSRATPELTARGSRWSRATRLLQMELRLISRIYSTLVRPTERPVFHVTQTSGRRQSTILFRQIQPIFPVRATPRVERASRATLNVCDGSVHPRVEDVQTLSVCRTTYVYICTGKDVCTNFER